MMYHLDDRRHRQSLVYFGEPAKPVPSDLAYRHTRRLRKDTPIGRFTSVATHLEFQCTKLLSKELDDNLNMVGFNIV